MKGVILLGVPRSGTTLLRRLVDAHPAFACPGETFIFTAASRYLHEQPVSNGLDVGVVAGLGFAGFSEADVLARLRRLTFSFAEEHAARVGKPRWAEKSAPDVFHLSAIERLCGDEVQYVCITRHALDAIVSLHELVQAQQRWSAELHPYVVRNPRPYEALAQAWSDGTSAMLDLVARRPEAATMLRYEDLVEDPSGTMGRVMAHLGEAWPAGLEATALAAKGEIGLGDWKTYATDSVERGRVGRGRSLSRLTAQELAPLVNGALVRAGYDALPEGERPTQERARRLFEAAMKVQPIRPRKG